MDPGVPVICCVGSRCMPSNRQREHHGKNSGDDDGDDNNADEDEEESEDNEDEIPKNPGYQNAPGQGQQQPKVWCPRGDKVCETLPHCRPQDPNCEDDGYCEFEDQECVKDWKIMKHQYDRLLS